MLSDLRPSAQCQTESPQLSLPWTLFEGTSVSGAVREDQRPPHHPQAPRKCTYWFYLKDLFLTFWGGKWMTLLTIAKANFIASVDNNMQQFKNILFFHIF